MNKHLVIEDLRELAEILLYGDSHEPPIIECFLEKNMFHHFQNFVSLKFTKVSPAVCLQVFQTLSILVENLKSQTTLYYIFSNNHINNLITSKIDLANEEILARYIAFIKFLSLKLDSQTIHLFLNNNQFPLYSEALPFMNHHDSMVRVSARTALINIFQVESTVLDNFLQTHVRSLCLRFLSFSRKLILKQDEPIGSSNYADEILSIFEYLNDLFLINKPLLSEPLLEIFLQDLFFDLLVRSLQDTNSPPINPSLALHLLSQAIMNIEYKPFVSELSCAIFHSDAHISVSGLRSSLHFANSSRFIHFNTNKRNPHREYILSLIRSAEDSSLNLAITLIFVILTSPYFDNSIIFKDSKEEPEQLLLNILKDFIKYDNFTLKLIVGVLLLFIGNQLKYESILKNTLPQVLEKVNERWTKSDVEELLQKQPSEILRGLALDPEEILQKNSLNLQKLQKTRARMTLPPGFEHRT
eukprot:TRINITY_DN4535_c0_g2_i1.p1 TRINITY_DN4535_c0_g2~~TRINITY_DN4535_c0_g2_i1.p1  ORF type:complete len:512 (-),score=81.83 TRINITY_DN4535_c0_g2_i1:37-1449(-)